MMYYDYHCMIMQLYVIPVLTLRQYTIIDYLFVK